MRGFWAQSILYDHEFGITDSLHLDGSMADP